MTKPASPVITVKAVSLTRSEAVTNVSLLAAGISTWLLGKHILAGIDLALWAAITLLVVGRMIGARRQAKEIKADLRAKGYTVR